MKVSDIDVNAISASQLAQTKWHIPASVSIAQYGQESGWGKHAPGNNPFGIKALPGFDSRRLITREDVGAKVVTEALAFAVFPTLASAFDEHARILATHPAYAHARSLLPDVDAFVDALTGVYATDRNYGTELKGIIHNLNLLQFDVQVTS